MCSDLSDTITSNDANMDTNNWSTCIIRSHKNINKYLLRDVKKLSKLEIRLEIFCGQRLFGLMKIEKLNTYLLREWYVHFWFEKLWKIK